MWGSKGFDRIAEVVVARRGCQLASLIIWHIVAANDSKVVRGEFAKSKNVAPLALAA